MGIKPDSPACDPTRHFSASWEEAQTTQLRGTGAIFGRIVAASAYRVDCAPTSAESLMYAQQMAASGSELEGRASAEDAARAAIDASPVWYHTIDLVPGIATPGLVDHRDYASIVLPDDLSGLRALDVGTFDGFWAFELEKRGAEVVAIDVEQIDAAQWPPLNRERLLRDAEEFGLELGVGFKAAHSALNSKVDRRICDVNDLTPEKIGGPVDLAFGGDIMLHLRDPVGALERMRNTLKPGGRLRMFEPFSMRETLRAPRRPLSEFSPLTTNFTWWYPNYAALVALPIAAGFADVHRVKLLRSQGPDRGMRCWHGVIEGWSKQSD